jgi:hypothetical protein
MIAGVADDEMAGLRKGLLDLAGDRGVHGREDELGRAARAGPGLLHDEVGHIGGNRDGQPPRRGLAIGLPGRSLAGAHPGQAEPGMVCELRDELLAHHAGGPKDADVDPLHCPFLPGRPEGLRYTGKKKPAGCYVGGLLEARV